MAEADAADAAEADAEESKDQVPEDLNLLYFLEREELSDCSISLPASGASPAKEVNCHRLALCSTSGYCFRKFLVPDAPKILKLPELPDDAELRRQMPLQSLFQLVLRFAYCGQKWEPLKELVTPESFPGLYALAKLLDARALVVAADKAMDLNPGTAAKLLYVASQLKDQADFDEAALDRYLNVVRDGFGPLCSSPDMGLLAKLPVSLLVRLLEQDALNVPQEENVLRFVRHVLWRRLNREEKLLTLSGGLEGLESLEGLQLRWESMAGEDVGSGSPAADRYSASEAAAEGSADIPELSHRIPAESGTTISLRALKGEEVLFVAKLPIDLEEPATEDLRQCLAFLQDGKSVTIRYKYTLSEAPAEEPPADPPAAPEGAEGAEGAEVKESTKPDAALSAEETKRLLGVVRFGQLDHQQLLLAVKDPVLEKAGAQPHLLGALSARLARYEAAEAVAPVAPGPRPSTQGAQPTQATQATQATVTPETPAAPPPPGAQATPWTKATQTPGAPAPPAPPWEGGPVLLRGSMGATLFPCTCGEGRMQLRQAEGRFVARCNRMASCGQAIWLPNCVVAAAVDGHCAVCAMRLGAEVRTLTVRLGRDQGHALRKLPSGVDTLRGMCIAGCHDMLSILG